VVVVTAREGSHLVPLASALFVEEVHDLDAVQRRPVRDQAAKASTCQGDGAAPAARPRCPPSAGSRR